ncbi:MAG TPA: hypothetical protein VJB66_05010 [Candidatus Nanoarchaeia archaeon]|nr:hypothetical protein [Candidatus Nanoarchaeia archaeon]
MKRDSHLFVQDIISAMKSIEDFIGNMTLGELKADDKTASAVIRNVRNFNYKNADGKFLSMLKNH